MGKRKKNRIIKDDGLTANAREIVRYQGWHVSIFNQGAHLRINGVIDVWPTRKRWMPTHHGPRDFAQNYRDLSHLKTIVADAQGAREPRKTAAEWFASLPQERKQRVAPEALTWDEFARRFGGSQPAPKLNVRSKRPTNPRLFDSSKPKRDPLAAHKARVIEDWGPEYVPDPNFERPPWD